MNEPTASEWLLDPVLDRALYLVFTRAVNPAVRTRLNTRAA